LVSHAVQFNSVHFVRFVRALSDQSKQDLAPVVYSRALHPYTQRNSLILILQQRFDARNHNEARAEQMDIEAKANKKVSK